MSAQPWIRNRSFDLWWILGPAWFSLVLVALIPANFAMSDGLQPWVWLVCIAGIDVSHVYATLYRTYWNPEARQQYRQILLLVPVLCFLSGCLLYSYKASLFWSLMAYLAVFHFIRQQYGFMRIYARNETQSRWQKQWDALAIYAATLYPIIDWHLGKPRNFHWFVDGDFWLFPEQTQLQLWLRALYFAIEMIWLLHFMYQGIRKNSWNWPKAFLLGGTLASWYFGIVWLNDDLSFTILNVVSHGIPYMALVWHFTKSESKRSHFSSHWMHKLMQNKLGWLVFIVVLMGIGLAEEALWDGLVWQDHPMFFKWIYISWAGLQMHEIQAILIPLLALPQLSHYVLDGFIWKLRKTHPTRLQP